MTTVVNFYGGPGAGKSTLAASTFAELKNMGVNCELVFEYVKTWAWESRTPSKYDELYIFGQQVRRETLLYGKVDFVLTDRPLRMSGFYAKHFGQQALGAAMDAACAALEHEAHLDGHEFINVQVQRISAYNPKGRYQTEDQALEIDCTVDGLVPFQYITTKEHGRALAQALRRRIRAAASVSAPSSPPTDG